MTKPKVLFVNLGCPKNLVDSEILMGHLRSGGAEIVDSAEDASDIVVNTCGFIEDAKRESIETILEAVQLKEMDHKRVFVTGCLSQRYMRSLQEEIPEVDAFFGARNISGTARELAQKMGLDFQKSSCESRLVSTAVYAYLKIAEGCDNTCSFCAIPFIRGPHVSRPKAEILDEAKRLVDGGVQELIVISQDTTYYGKDLQEGSSLTGLLSDLSEIPGLRWIRLLYAYPDRVSDPLIRLMADRPNICPYIDVPIQHISGRVLERMRRGFRRGEIERLIEKLRTKIPDIAIRTSVMVGFPGETDADFQELLDFVEATKFEHLGIFRFSREEDTLSFDLPDQVPEPVKKERFEYLQSVQQDIAYRKNQSFVGKTMDVLVEQFDPEQNVYLGRTQWDAPEIDSQVVLKGDFNIGEFFPVVIASASEAELVVQSDEAGEK
ncbi:ribosomal protein S12 methylthiotransferase RimO [bacterium BMS3Abin05]|nr:ribosomal protein S12 methylthiotransferase RimO [bacterium BMS3Abin05]GBE26416.1 ribosomal protein S12 methylthiotransferase RimO [bacterium BMS3Bbin03]HDK35851.1 30S ribosomal protein S12 methylthiotransferase RimO [Bacteroidota bacterium]HDZ11045.1 30S ribosomal protein S12 methylthiotransferase RimO [Bacteroidota bacterium]